MQRTLIIFKPDCVQRRLVGQILARFEAKGLRAAALKLIQVDRALGEKHYAEHQGKPFFEGLISFITGGPVVVGVLEGNEAIAVVRTMLGATNGVAAAPGTVRGDFSISKQNNLVHGSDSPESALREIALWFRPEEVVGYSVAGEEWVFSGLIGSRPTNMARASRKKGVFANPFYVALMVVSTLFVVTALAYLVSPYVLEPGSVRGAPSHDLALWLDRQGPLVLGVEFVVMMATGVLAMLTDDWFSGSTGGR